MSHEHPGGGGYARSVCQATTLPRGRYDMGSCLSLVLEMQYFSNTLPAYRRFSQPAVVRGALRERTGKLPVTVNLISNTGSINAGQFAGNKSWPAVKADIYVHST